MFITLVMMTAFTRLKRFGNVMHDEIEFRYSNFIEYVDKTEMEFIPINHRKKKNVDVGKSYANLQMHEFWKWDFRSMVVEERSKKF
jgi:uncharacterized protein YlbG (UPF0298 family)